MSRAGRWYDAPAPRLCRAVDVLMLVLLAGALVVLAVALARRDELLTGLEAIAFLAVAPALLAVVLASSFAFRAPVRLHLVLALGSGLAAAWCLEAVLAVGVSLDRAAAGTTQTTLDAVAAERRQGRDTFPVINAGDSLVNFSPTVLAPRLRLDGLEILPLGSIGGARQVYCLGEDGPVAYEADRHGYRNPDEMWEADEAAAVVLGDSFARGLCVDDESVFASRMRERLGVVVNLGTNGAGPLFNLAALREYGARVRPRVVIWTHSEGNDVPADLEYERKSALLMRYRDPSFSQGLAAQQNAINELLRTDALARMEAAFDPSFAAPSTGGLALVWLRSVALLSRLRGHAEARFHRLLYRPDYDLFRNILATAQADAISWGGRVYFVTLPSSRSLAAGDFVTEPAIQELLDALGIPEIDVQGAFARAGPAGLFDARNGHFSPEGHRQMAEAIIEGLASGRGESIEAE